MVALTETKTQPVPLSRIFCFGGESVGKLLPACSDCVPGAVQEQYKSGPFSSLSHPLLSPPPPWNKVSLKPFLLLVVVLLQCISTHTCPFVPCRVLERLVVGEGRGQKFCYGEKLGLG